MTKVVRRPRFKRPMLVLSVSMFLITYTATTMIRLKYGDVLEEFRRSFYNDVLFLPDDTSCYHDAKGNYSTYKFTSNSIFLISASCEESLTMQQACSIESVYRAHPNRIIYVLFTRPLKECPCTEGLIAGLQSIPYVRFQRIQIDKYVEGTPLDGIFKDKFLVTGLRQHRKTTEVLKFITLHKYGGVVIDLDMIMAKQIDFLGVNWGVKYNSSILGSAIMAVDKNGAFGRGILPRVLSLLKEHRNQREINGGQILTDAFKDMCYDGPEEGCSDFKIYDTEYFYPINKTSNEMYFEKGHLHSLAYGYNIWASRRTRLNQATVYVQLMREYCPDVMSFF